MTKSSSYLPKKEPLLIEENQQERASTTSRQSSVIYEDYTGNPTIIFEDLIPSSSSPTSLPLTTTTDITQTKASIDIQSKELLLTSFNSTNSSSYSSYCSKSFKDYYILLYKQFFNNWTEDGIGLLVSLSIFIFTTILSVYKQNIDDYSKRQQWPLGMAGIGLYVVIISHYLMKKKQAYEGYLAIIAIAMTAQAIGKYNIIKESGLSGSFWAIILGMLLRYFGLNSTGGVLSGEFFIKIGVTLMAMDFSKVVQVGLPGLMVAWGDTIIVASLGSYLAMKLMGMNLKDSIVVAGATSICGSSAATAISAAIHVQSDPSEPPYVDQACSTVIALMGMLNTPLMPILPLLRTRMNMNPVIIGSWIGGSIDSTGQVVASASLAGSAVLESATIIKMAQNVLIGPISLGLTIYFQKSFKPSILLDKFPLFVFGFFITSLIANIIRYSGVNEDISDLVISNSWFLSEWINLIGFARIGLMIDVNTFIKNTNDHVVLYTYLMVQCIDLITTFAWSYLLFKGSSYEDDDE